MCKTPMVVHGGGCDRIKGGYMRYLNSKRLAVSAGLLFCLSLIGCSSSKDTDEVKREDIKTLSVTGVGEVRVLPDQFVLTGAVIQQKNTTREDRTNGTLREGEPRVTKKVCDDESQQASISFTFTAGPSDLAGDLLSGFSQAGAIRLNLDGYKVANIDELELKAGPHINTFGAGESTSLVDGGDPIEVTAMNLVAGEQVISASVALEFIYE